MLIIGSSAYKDLHKLSSTHCPLLAI